MRALVRFVTALTGAERHVVGCLPAAAYAKSSKAGASNRSSQLWGRRKKGVARSHRPCIMPCREPATAGPGVRCCALAVDVQASSRLTGDSARLRLGKILGCCSRWLSTQRAKTRRSAPPLATSQAHPPFNRKSDWTGPQHARRGQVNSNCRLGLSSVSLLPHDRRRTQMPAKLALTVPALHFQWATLRLSCPLSTQTAHCLRLLTSSPYSPSPPLSAQSQRPDDGDE